MQKLTYFGKLPKKFLPDLVWSEPAVTAAKGREWYWSSNYTEYMGKSDSCSYTFREEFVKIFLRTHHTECNANKVLWAMSYTKYTTKSVWWFHLTLWVLHGIRLSELHGYLRTLCSGRIQIHYQSQRMVQHWNGEPAQYNLSIPVN